MILFNPEEDIFYNIKSYVEQLDELIIIDNSEKINNTLKKNITEYDKVKYIFNGKNSGMAKALNQALELAYKSNYDFLFTMDQDGNVAPDLIEKLLSSIQDFENIGIISAYHLNDIYPLSPKDNNNHEVLVTMTNANLININIAIKVGGFLEKLFIDYVDNEFCLRLNANNYKVIRVNSVRLRHHLGVRTQKKIFFKNTFPTNHSPLRLYYRTRNRLFVRKTYKNIYPTYIRRDRMDFVKEFIKIIFFETEKIKKLRMIYIGYLHFKKNVYGAYK